MLPRFRRLRARSHNGPAALHFRLMRAAVDAKDLSTAEYAVLTILIHFADNATGVCWPGVETIAEKAKMDERTARRLIGKLIAKGWVHRTPRVRDRRTNVYTVTVPVRALPALPTLPAQEDEIPDPMPGVPGSYAPRSAYELDLESGPSSDPEPGHAAREIQAEAGAGGAPASRADPT